MLTNFNPYSVQFPMFQGPTPMQTPVPSQTYVQNIPSVNGIEEAKSLNIGKNATALILDANQGRCFCCSRYWRLSRIFSKLFWRASEKGLSF